MSGIVYFGFTFTFFATIDIIIIIIIIIIMDYQLIQFRHDFLFSILTQF
jgi:hypothetical protein